MIDTSKAREVMVHPDDVLSYFEIQQLLNRLSLGNFPIDYVKSAPYLLSFMNYKIKDKIYSKLEKNRCRLLIKKVQNLIPKKKRYQSLQKNTF